MIIRILSFTLAAAWFAAAAPARAYDPSDPGGPPPDDPAAWATLGTVRTQVGNDLERCDMMFADAPSAVVYDDPAAQGNDSAAECSCQGCALPMDRSGKGHAHHAARTRG